MLEYFKDIIVLLIKSKIFFKLKKKISLSMIVLILMNFLKFLMKKITLFYPQEKQQLKIFI